MDYFARMFSQFAERVREMTPGMRIAAGALAIALVAGAAYLSQGQASHNEVYLFGGDSVSARELEAMEAAFGGAGLHEAVVENNCIRVPRGKQAEYMKALADAGALPHHPLDSLSKAWESGGLLASRRTQEGLYKTQIQKSLSNIVSQLPWVEWATVLYNEEPTRGLNSKRKITATVHVKPLGQHLLTAKQVEMIRVAVGPSLGGAPEDVAVVDFNGAPYRAGASEVGAGHDRYLAAKLQYEKEYAENISRALSQFITGSVVTVNVELNREFEEIESSTTVDPPMSPVRVRSESAAADSQIETAADDATNKNANVPAMIGRAVFDPPGPTSDLAAGQRQVNYRSRQVRRAGLTPKAVTVSVGVPSSYFEQVWRERQRTAPGEAARQPAIDPQQLAEIEARECEKIQRHVMQVVPMPLGEENDPNLLVTVTKFQDFAAPSVAPPSSTERALVFLEEHAGSIGLGVLAVIGLLVVRSMVRLATSEKQPTVALQSTDIEPQDEVELSSLDAEAPPRLRRLDRPTLRDELGELIRDDPDAAAKVLRNWIGSAN